MIKVNTTNMATAVQLLKRGGIGLVPTDTNYGLAVDPYNLLAGERLYAVKKREAHKPLTLFIAKAEEIYAFIDQGRVKTDLLEAIVGKYWPGPLNLVLPKNIHRAPGGPYFDADSISIVCNENKALRALIKAFGRPLALTSANFGGETVEGLVNFEGAQARFGDTVDFILEEVAEARKNTTRSSTIIQINGEEIRALRQGDLIIDEDAFGPHP